MKNIKYILCFTLLIVCLNSCLNSALDQNSSYSLVFKQIEKDLVVKHSFIFPNEKRIELVLPEDFRGFSSNVNYTLSGRNLIIGGKEIVFSYITNEYLLASKKYEFLYRLVYPENFDNAIIKFYLDSGFVVNSDDIFPTDSKIETDGQSISITWEITNVKFGEVGAFFIIFEDITTQNSSSKYYLIIMIIIFISFLAWLFYLIRKRLEKAKNFEEYLNDNEKRIIKELKQANRNELWQKQIQIKTGFSKAKLSRLIRDLESRNLIKRIPFGNTNKISLR